MVAGATRVAVAAQEEAAALVRRAAAARACEATAMNAASSRSHSVFMLNIAGAHAASGARLQGALNLVDLAGRRARRAYRCVGYLGLAHAMHARRLQGVRPAPAHTPVHCSTWPAPHAASCALQPRSSGPTWLAVAAQRAAFADHESGSGAARVRGRPRCMWPARESHRVHAGHAHPARMWRPAHDCRMHPQ